MARKALSLYKYLLGGLLAFLGFTSCSDKGSTMVLYGTPYGTLDVKAKVLDPDGKPLSGATLQMRLETAGVHYYNGQRYESEGYVFPDRPVTDSKGEINVVYERRPDGPNKDRSFFVYHSADNPQFEGIYADDSVKMVLTKIEDADGWYWGRIRMEGTLKLKKKPSGQ